LSRDVLDGNPSYPKDASTPCLVGILDLDGGPAHCCSRCVVHSSQSVHDLFDSAAASAFPLIVSDWGSGCSHKTRQIPFDDNITLVKNLLRKIYCNTAKVYGAFFIISPVFTKVYGRNRYFAAFLKLCVSRGSRPVPSSSSSTHLNERHRSRVSHLGFQCQYSHFLVCEQSSNIILAEHASLDLKHLWQSFLQSKVSFDPYFQRLGLRNLSL
jgi:hypothetical protein